MNDTSSKFEWMPSQALTAIWFLPKNKDQNQNKIKTRTNKFRTHLLPIGNSRWVIFLSQNFHAFGSQIETVISLAEKISILYGVVFVRPPWPHQDPYASEPISEGTSCSEDRGFYGSGGGAIKWGFLDLCEQAQGRVFWECHSLFQRTGSKVMLLFVPGSYLFLFFYFVIILLRKCKLWLVFFRFWESLENEKI